MSKGVGSGDKLARGAIKANFQTTEGGVTAEKWNSIFEDFNPTGYKNAPNQSSQRTEVSSGDASGESTGDAGAGVGETGTEPPTI